MSGDIVLADSAWEGVDASAQALLDSWLAQPGALVQAGDAVVRVVLVKSTIDVPAPTSGRLGAWLVNAGETFARGQPLARVTPEAP